MFTGLIQNIGTIRSVEKKGDWRIVIETGLDLARAPEGASICCSGCCLTIIEKGRDWFAVEVSAESMARTSLIHWKPGTKVNLEPSLRLGDELGGHFVFGHVDATARIESIEKEGDSYRFMIHPDPALRRYIAPKGSVALDGISLTVNEVTAQGFGVNIIPHTMSHTTLGTRKAGDELNFEVDMLARYVERMLGKESLKDAA